jgi:hypothetical protein
LVVSGVFGTSGVNSLHDQNQHRITGTSGTSHIGIVAISSSINTSITLSGVYGTSEIGVVAISSSINTSITLSGVYGNSGIGTVTTAST